MGSSMLIWSISLQEATTWRKGECFARVKGNVKFTVAPKMGNGGKRMSILKSGKVKIKATPKNSAAKQFFMRVKMKQ